ncbi:hypothetical protein JOD54_001115 [Actinokineospora baliensis]|uniref:hypothetical protein n=1 Tax=Actinokineospora baliensis TaxID=547056 RepID=UPI00195CDEB5|nr:hypothetical protein [Actinokineospora baliensis]MBM7770911.1 hypothetical protein [Actinokineospora baliensis]
MWTQIYGLVTGTGPWVLVAALATAGIWSRWLVGLILRRAVNGSGGTDVTVRARMLPWPRVEVIVRATPASDPGTGHGSVSGDGA